MRWEIQICLYKSKPLTQRSGPSGPTISSGPGVRFAQGNHVPKVAEETEISSFQYSDGVLSSTLFSVLL